MSAISHLRGYAPALSQAPLRRPSTTVLLLLALATTSMASVRRDERKPPPSIAHASVLLPVGMVDEWVEPALDVESLLEEDAVLEGPGVPSRVGIPIDLALRPENSGTWESLPDGGEVWRLRVTVPDAPWTSLVFTPFDVGDGVTLHVGSPDAAQVLGPFDRDAVTKADATVLATPLVAGESCLVELHFGSKASRDVDVRLRTLVAGYEPFGPGIGLPNDQPVPKAAQSCEVDVNCPQGASWQADKRAVAKIAFNGYVCTGTLLNDVPQDCRNYFLTANHCISTASVAAATVFYWNYERPSCGSGTPANHTQSGATLRATNAASDVTLLELSAAPSPTFNTYRAAWSRTSTAASSATAIHHPAGDVKKISFETHPVVNGVSMGSNYWRVSHWETGATEGGSSGSALFNPSHQVVGQLWGGTSQCPAPTTWDEYGKFSVSWGNGASAATRLRDWLDPGASSATSVGGKESSTCPQSTLCRTCPSTDFGPYSPTTTAQRHGSSIASSGCKLYAFRVSAGCSYRFTFCDDGGAVSWDSVLDLYDASCTLVASSDDSCGLASRLDYTATTTGTVFLKVRGYGASSFGSYTLAYRTLSCPQPCVACPSYDQALTPTTAYQTHSSSIVSNGCRIYRVGVTSGVRYRFTFCEGNGSVTWDSVLDRQSSSCVLQASQDDFCGLGSQMDFTASSTGYVYIKVRGYDAGSYGSYRIAYKRY